MPILSIKFRRNFFVFIFITVTLILTAVNINSYYKPQKIQVLGAVTSSDNSDFWEKFLADNPHYIPGWLEQGRLDKVRQIDPNYLR